LELAGLLALSYLFFIPYDLGWLTTVAVFLILLGNFWFYHFIRVLWIEDDIRNSPYGGFFFGMCLLLLVAVIVLIAAYYRGYLPVDYEILARREVLRGTWLGWLWWAAFLCFWGIYLLVLPFSPALLFAAIVMSNDRRKFNKIYTDGKIRNFMCDKEIFTMHEFLENLGGRKSPERVGFAIKDRLDKHFVTVKGDLPKDTYDAYCMPLIAYDRLKEEIENFLRGVAAHNIIDITEKTTGFVLKAYFIQRALNDLVAAGNVTQIDIGSSLDKKQNKKQSESKKEDEEQSTEEKNYIYQHRHSQRQMVSREIEID